MQGSLPDLSKSASQRKKDHLKVFEKKVSEKLSKQLLASRLGKSTSKADINAISMKMRQSIGTSGLIKDKGATPTSQRSNGKPFDLKK